MILLITPSARGQQCADALKSSTGAETYWAQNLQEAAARLRERTYSAAVIDQFLLETEPQESEQMLQHLGTAFPVYINFAVTGMERLVREVRSALHRRQREEAVARLAIEDQMRSEMRETLTAMLLSCELAMACPTSPAPPRKRSAPSTILPANCVSAGRRAEPATVARLGPWHTRYCHHERECSFTLVNENRSQGTVRFYLASGGPLKPAFGLSGEVE